MPPFEPATLCATLDKGGSPRHTHARAHVPGARGGPQGTFGCASVRGHCRALVAE